MAKTTIEPTASRSQRRRFLGALGLGALGAVAGTARSMTAQGSAASRRPLMAGSLNLSEVSIVDSHMHPVGRTLISKTYAQQAETFANATLPPGEYPQKAAMTTRAVDGARALIWDAPRRIGYFDYIARTYHVPPTLAGFDGVVSPHLQSDSAFSAYIASILDRENIQTVVLQAAEEAPAAPATLIPKGRYVWTTVVSEFTRLDWAKSRNLTSLKAVVEAIDQTMQSAAAHGARGFKNISAYYRPLALSKPSAHDAEVALQRLLSAPTAGVPFAGEAGAKKTPAAGPNLDQPRYEDDVTLRNALISYEDFLFRHIYAAAGRLDRPIIIHSAVALHPSLRVEFNDPRSLYDVFTDADIQKAGTQFVIIHAGYPWQDVMAAFISQFPNVYTDISFYSKYPGALSRLYESLLGIGPSEKIMHGSDANSVPEEVGYCAWNSRAALGKVLTVYKTDWGWSQSDLSRAASNILGDNARRLFSINR